MEKTEIVDRAKAILETVNSVFGANDEILPERQYITVGGTGTAVHDYEQVTVAFETAQAGLPGQQNTRPLVCNGPTSVLFVVEITRCIPTGSSTRSQKSTAPSVEQLTATATQQMKDAAILKEVGVTAILDTWADEGSSEVTIGKASGTHQAVVLVINCVA